MIDPLPCYCAAKLAKEIRADYVRGSALRVSLVSAVREAKEMLKRDPSLHECSNRKDA